MVVVILSNSDQAVFEEICSPSLLAIVCFHPVSNIATQCSSDQWRTETLRIFSQDMDETFLLHRGGLLGGINGQRRLVLCNDTL